MTTQSDNTLDELDEIVRRIHFSQASFNELTKEELYEDIGDDCLRVINKGKKAIQALYAPKPVENGELRETILSILGIVDRTSGNRPEQIATLEQEITAHTNAEIARTLDRLESTAVYAEYDKAEDDVICGDVVPLDAIQAERAKLKEVK